MPSTPKPAVPQPGWLLLLNGSAVIAVCVALFGVSLGIVCTKNHPLLILAAPLMLLVPLLIAAMQYRAIFHRSEKAARNVGNYLFAAGGLLAIFFAMMTYINASNAKEFDYRGVAALTFLTLFGVYLLLCGRSNQNWAKRLNNWEETNSPQTDPCVTRDSTASEAKETLDLEEAT